MVRLFSIVVLLAIHVAGFCQADSLAVANAKWKTKKIGKGIKLKEYWFNKNLFNANQNISVLEVNLKKRYRVDVGAEPTVLKGTSKFGEQHKAIAAVNGTFFDMKNGGSVDYIRLDGQVLNQNRLQKGGVRALHQKAALVVRNNKLYIEAWDGSAHWEDSLKGDDVMVTGPLLLKDHQRAALDSTSMYTARHPRTAVAVKGNTLLLITVDGRNDRAAGMSLFELASLMKWLQADDAVNLDGGGSTTLWINGFPDGGIVNHPSDNNKMKQSAAYKPGMDLDNLAADQQKWDHDGERPVANVILISRK